VKDADARALDALLAEARADPDVLAVLLFGSAAREGEGRDVDVCVVLRPDARRDPQDAHLRYLGHASGKRHEGLDVSVFQALPLYVRRQVLRDAVPLLLKDEDALYEIALQTVRAWTDFKPHYETYLEAVERAWS
jgi:predicted nucleotidyltransferase